MLKLGIIGYPLGHSLSPVMQNVALKKLGIDGSYVALETPPEKLAERIDFLKNEEFRGFNVTIPHKIEIMKYLDSIDNFAKVVGAVNTVVIDENKKFHGYNTDVYGFVQAIPEEIRENLAGKKAAVLGSGGAARAVLVGLIEIGIKEISIFARNQEKSFELKEVILKNFSDVKINCVLLGNCHCEEQSDEAISSLVQSCDRDTSLAMTKLNLSGFSIVVNTTLLGMNGENQEISPLSQESISTLPKDALVYDIVYKPQKTRLLEYAEKRGLKTLNGFEMLVLQGAKSFELWTGQKPPIKTMRESLF